MATDDLPVKSGSLWVRKLAGKPEDFTPPDRESEARRIHGFGYENVSILLAASSKAVRIHSDRLRRDLAIAARIVLASSGRTLTCNKIARFCDLATLGLPIFGFIKTLSITKIIVDKNHTLGNTFSQEERTIMANNLPTEKKTAVISMLAEGSSIRAIERIKE
jgi:hypothetical protein